MVRNLGYAGGEPTPARIFIASTAEDLAEHRREVARSIEHYGQVIVRMESFGARAGDPVDVCRALVGSADAVVVLVAHRYGWVPSRAQRGDGKRSITWHEVEAAVDAELPLFAYLVDPEFAWEYGKEQDRLKDPAENAAQVKRTVQRLDEFKQRLRRGRIPESFTSPDNLAKKVSRDLGNWLLREWRVAEPRLRLRQWSSPDLPEEPYPVLRPYEHSELFAGRDRELDELLGMVDRDTPVLGLFAVSGAGKSSLLRAGLIPRLRAANRPVAYTEYPHEPGLAAQLIGDLLQGTEEPAALEDGDFEAFEDHLRLVHELAGWRAPVLVLDQFESLLRLPIGDARRATVGALLAASARRRPGVWPLCRWVLAYREEFHGRVEAWLGDVVRDAEIRSLPGVRRLPRDLSTAERFHSWSVPVLGTAAPGATDRRAAARGSFLAAIEKPLGVTGADGQERYPWRFAGDGAERLADAFADERERQPDAPLVPELQVVLAHLLSEAGAAPAEIRVPELPAAMIARALEEHLRRALDAPFTGCHEDVASQGRSWLLLALHELTDGKAKRGEGLPAAELERRAGQLERAGLDGAAGALARLARPDTRVLVLVERQEGRYYELSHDRMAEVIASVVQEEGLSGELGLDPEILGLRRYVQIMTALYRSGETKQATSLPGEHFQGVAANDAALLWSEDQERWWQACEQRREFDWAGEKIGQSIGPQALEGLAALVADEGIACESWARQRARRLWAGRYWPSVFDNGALALAEADRERILLGAARSAAVLSATRPADVDLPDLATGRLIEVVGAVAWALDCFCARSPVDDVRVRAARRREALLEALRAQRPPPPLDDDLWAEIPGGTFDMGTGDRAKPAGGKSERPQHRVTVSPFRMLVHPVTNRQYRRLTPRLSRRGYSEYLDREADDDLPDDDRPVVGVTWYQAYGYAAWLGGRLPSEAEWEYAARAGCPHSYCDRRGRETTVDKVAWFKKNTKSLRPVMGREPSPWGLYDLHGSVWEWVVDVHFRYPADEQTDPWGPSGGKYAALKARDRVIRGGSYENDAWSLRSACRNSREAERVSRHPPLGFRVVLPGGSSRAAK